MAVLCINISFGLFSHDSCTKKFEDEFQTGGGECHRVYIHIIHFYCLAVEAVFYSDVVECLPVDPAIWVRFPAWTGKIFSVYDIINASSPRTYKSGYKKEINANIRTQQ